MPNYIPKLEYTSAPITITFEFPPDGDNLRERGRANQRTVTSTGGIRQTQFNYNTRLIRPQHTFISQAILDTLRTFFEDHGSRGLEFKYFESSDEVEFFTVTLNSKTFNPVKLFPDSSGGHVWSLNMSMIYTL